MKQRVGELDFLKCIFILLMIVFHLVYIGDKYPHAKEFVYTFHMSAFLVISGYVMSVDKGWKHFLRTMLWLFVPYLVMELSYVVVSYYLPVRGGVETLSVDVLADKVFLHPMGPYWYLHTLIICGSVYFLANFLNGLFKDFMFLVVVTGIACAAISYFLGLVSMSSVMYFLIGVMLSKSGTAFVPFFRPSPVAVLPVVLLFLFPLASGSFSVWGLVLTFSVISLLLFVYSLLPSAFLQPFLYVGRHTLPLLLFSPIFTMMVKPLVGVFAFDSTGLLFMAVSVLIAVLGSFFIVWILEQAGLARFFFGRYKVL